MTDDCEIDKSPGIESVAGSSARIFSEDARGKIVEPSRDGQEYLERDTWCSMHLFTQGSTDSAQRIFLSVPPDGSERTAVTFRFGLFLFFFSPSSLLPLMHPSSFEGTRGRIRARAGHDRRTNSDRRLLFFSPGLTSSSFSYFPSESCRPLRTCGLRLLELAIF